MNRPCTIVGSDASVSVSAAAESCRELHEKFSTSRDMLDLYIACNELQTQTCPCKL